MPFNRPTLKDLITETQTDLDLRVLKGAARAARRVTSALARVFAAGLHGLYAYIGWGTRQAFVHLADEEGVADHGLTWGISRKPAVAAAGTVTFGGTNGAPLATDSIIQADERRWRVTAGAVVAAGSVTVPVICQSTGEAGNAPPGLSVSLLSPSPGIESRGIVAGGGIVGGVDMELLASWQARIFARIQTPPHGGNRADYRTWALEVPGVAQAWVTAGELGAGTVIIRVWGASGAPDAGVVAAAQAHITSMANVVGDPVVLVPDEIPLNVVIGGLVPAGPEVRAAVIASLSDLLAREAHPGGTILISHIREAISLAAGEWDHELIAPVANVHHLAGQMAVPGVVSWS